MDKIFKKSILFYLCCACMIRGNEKISLTGFIENNQSITIPDSTDDWDVDGMIHNRINLLFQPFKFLQMSVSLRTRLFWGESIEKQPYFKDVLEKDNGLIDLSHVFKSGNSYMFHSCFDRLFIEVTKDKWSLRIGRQRINWGINLSWNPNDLFNASSPIDFDYEEGGGTDAILCQFYTGDLSDLQLVINAESVSGKRWGIASLFRFNKWNYDFQILGGFVRNQIIAGTGWSGQIGNGGFRGELSLFYNPDTNSNRPVNTVFSTSYDYVFINKVFFQASFLFNSSGSRQDTLLQLLINTNNILAESLSPSKINMFFDISCQFTPLFKGGFITILSPFTRSAFLRPSIELSLTQNLDLSFSGIIPVGEKNTEYGAFENTAYCKIKWNF